MGSREAARPGTFGRVLGNTAAAMLGTAFIWFGITFWAYLETRSVLATSFLGGAYMLGMAVMGVPFGTLVDRHHKHKVMVASAVGTALVFLLAVAVYLLTPPEVLVDLGRPWFWVFCLLVLSGAMLASIRSIALATCVTILVESDRRANANGLVGTVNGMTMMVTGIFSGLAIGQLGLFWTLMISLAIVLVSLVHLLTIRIPEPEIVHAEGAPKAVDFKGAWLAVVAVPGLIGLILFSTFNNFLGGVFMGLLDPYGLELVSVEWWGILFGLSGVGFLIGGGIIARKGLGRLPLRTLLFASLAMWVIAGAFTIRDSVVLLVAGLVAYMALMPFIEGAEQTLLQQVVPLAKQGRVFGFAQAVEVSAAPISAFVIGPMAQFWLIPYAESPAGRRQWGWLLGHGDARGIALVFVIVSIGGLILTTLVFFTRTYRRLNATYEAGDVNLGVATPGASHPVPGPDPLGKGHSES
ncbi:MFS transporter [Tessaracoccus sp. MC1865]|uniref:MFS transporter n=1 Tax=Tessaracoccus sp. MC1865 TaxID=2760310 RepID=UPI001AE85711|nr:MFS transporter [Tessaracoccus sp. MC1865]QTO37174.1 MFS transporter [Tessaracoccus sp. MC1865]